MKRVSSLLYALIILPAAVAYADNTPALSIEAQTNALVFRSHPHGVPYGEAQHLGSAAVPHLADLLHQESMKPHYRTIVQVLNFSGSPNALPVLRDFVVLRFRGEISTEEYLAVSAAIFTMGPLARISPAAMQFLIRGTDPSSWGSLMWTYGRYEGKKRNLSLSQACLVALGSSGTEEADEFFKKMIQVGSKNRYWSDLREMVREVMATNQEIIGEGFENHRRRRDEYFAKHGGATRD